MLKLIATLDLAFHVAVDCVDVFVLAIAATAYKSIICMNLREFIHSQSSEKK